MEPFLKSHKTLQTPAQTAYLKDILYRAGLFTTDTIKEFAACVDFTPTQEWIESFKNLNLYFYKDGSAAQARFKILHSYGIPAQEKAEPWVPQNGELIEAFWGGWYRAFYIGADTGYTHVVRGEGSDEQYRRVAEIRKWQKTQVPLAELLSVYASVKGLTQDGVELKPEN